MSRVQPIVRACATASTAARFAALSDLLWQPESLLEQQELIQALQNSPELLVESAEEIHYWAHHALAMTFEATQGQQEPEASDARAEACCALGRNIAGDFDGILDEDEGAWKSHFRLRESMSNWSRQPRVR
ncbi:hypothetical protein [Streptomyces cupreus]|uniref:Uncharacterized protein n=1 Tax=Streptomyces cupreus TaxID=2759956 RepID=A0A7X1MDI6_9ACTN|nr:hypothetical protein [Streptomyces cupreus]MBC2907013.1 hypothetical protein [Streptomyces cupreus]